MSKDAVSLRAQAKKLEAAAAALHKLADKLDAGAAPKKAAATVAKRVKKTVAKKAIKKAQRKARAIRRTVVRDDGYANGATSSVFD